MRPIDADALKEKKVYSHERHERIVPVAEIDSMPTIAAIPMDWMDAQIRGYASALKSTELKALVLVKQMWEKEQEGQNG